MLAQLVALLCAGVTFSLLRRIRDASLENGVERSWPEFDAHVTQTVTTFLPYGIAIYEYYRIAISLPYPTYPTSTRGHAACTAPKRVAPVPTCSRRISSSSWSRSSGREYRRTTQPSRRTAGG